MCTSFTCHACSAHSTTFCRDTSGDPPKCNAVAVLVSPSKKLVCITCQVVKAVIRKLDVLVLTEPWREVGGREQEAWEKGEGAEEVWELEEFWDSEEETQHGNEEDGEGAKGEKDREGEGEKDGEAW